MTKIEVGEVYGGRVVHRIERVIIGLDDGGEEIHGHDIQHYPEGNLPLTEWDTYEEFIDGYVEDDHNA